MESGKTKEIRVKTVVIGAFVFLLLVVAIATVCAYAFPDNRIAVRLRDMLPYPALVVDKNHVITFRETDNDLASIRRFYESQADDLSQAGFRIDFSTPDGQKRLKIREKELLNKLVEDIAIQKLAEERGISIESDAVSREVNRKIGTGGGSEEEISQRLQRLYGWSVADFETKVVQPEMYRDALEKVYSQGIDVSSRAKGKITDASNELKRGTSFEDAARKYSEGTTAQSGGELGWIPVSTLAPEITTALRSQKIGQVSDIIESPLGFHIVAIEERRTDQGQELLRLKQIFARKVTFSDWLTDQMKRIDVTVLFKGYLWDKETAQIEFSRSDMKTFEDEMLRNPENSDASLMF